MLVKEKYLKALDELVRYADIGRQRHGATGCDIDSYVSNREALLCELIAEHFNPSAYRFEELEDGMWVWDDKWKQLRELMDAQDFEEGRFFPITKAYQERK